MMIPDARFSQIRLLFGANSSFVWQSIRRTSAAIMRNDGKSSLVIMRCIMKKQ